MFNDLVSVVITNYNYGKYLSRAIRSCLSQKHLDVEILVVDDNSNDESDKVLEIIEKVAVKYSDASVSKSYLKAMENQAKKRSAVILNPIDYISWDHSKL